jgi:hypothetical protein
MADQPRLPNYTKIRFTGAHGGVNQPAGIITGYEKNTGYYKCLFILDGQPWRPKLLRSEFTPIKAG